MRNLKFTVTFASLGFLLSLICGFFSRANFFKILLIAIIWAVVFAVLSVAISFIYNKFLAVDSEFSGNSDSNSGYSVSISSAANGKSSSTVNLVVPDAELERSGSDNHFQVGDNHQLLQESDRYNPENERVEQEKNSYAPIRKVENANNISGTEAITPGKDGKINNLDNINMTDSSGNTGSSGTSRKISNKAVANSMIDSDGSLDSLPDMNDVGFNDKVSGSADSSNESDDVDYVSDSSFVSSATNYNNSDVSSAEIKDASLMAKAISSILSEEDM